MSAATAAAELRGSAVRRSKSRPDPRSLVFALAWAIALVGFVLVTMQLPDGTAPATGASHSRT